MAYVIFFIVSSAVYVTKFGLSHNSYQWMTSLSGLSREIGGRMETCLNFFMDTEPDPLQL